MKKQRLMIAIVLLAIAVDTMGMGLVFPILPDLFFTHHAHLISINDGLFLRDFYYGLSLALWAGGIFFGSPFLGELSDRYGRKCVLSAALFLVGMSYFLSYLSLYLGSVSLFLLSRLLNGFFSSSFPLAQAIIIDASPEEVKARNLGWIVLAASVGFVLGPLLSAFCYQLAGGESGANWAFLSAGLLAILNASSVFTFLKESMQVISSRRIRILSVFTTCRFVFTDQRIRFLSGIFFLIQLAWGGYIQSIPVVLNQHFFLSPFQISLFYAFLGVSFFMMTVFLQPWLLKRFSLSSLACTGALGMLIFLIIAMKGHQLGLQYLAAFGASICDCLCYTTLLALFSNAVNPDEQGRVMGGTGALFGLTWGILALGLGNLLQFNLLAPIDLAILASGLAVVGVLWKKR